MTTPRRRATDASRKAGEPWSNNMARSPFYSQEWATNEGHTRGWVANANAWQPSLEFLLW